MSSGLHAVNVTEDLQKLLAFLPRGVQRLLKDDLPRIEEVKLRAQRPVWVLVDGQYRKYPYTVSLEDLAFLGAKCGTFRDDNRRGIDGTGHRITRVMMADGTPEGAPIGYTFRIGRYFEGMMEPLRPYIAENPSVLIIGEAGVGKTTVLRGTAKIAADYWPMQAVIVDTSGDVAGDGKVPHEGIGDVDVMPVRSKAMQAQLIEEAVKNQNVRVLIVDEINRLAEAEMIANGQRNGARLMGTTHGRDVKRVSENPNLAPLFHPEPVFYWIALIRERGVIEMMKATDAVQAIAEGRKPEGTLVRLGKGI
ncbi:AAA family ATPase [Deinococcus sp. S9]|uniref:AAA family ATPase n=1 Tax=Deinococcus sp. S9 TaxID=2545754 RepID=UPI001055210C|nr:AAA family ATPase [Deinococcus sp. S9]TDE84949.1 AAA family ATPase [Deinococcus sp. S9]